MTRDFSGKMKKNAQRNANTAHWL